MFRAFMIKRELKRLRNVLEEIAGGDTNMLLTTLMSDKDVVALAAGINAVLEQGRRGIFEKDRAEAALKRAVTNISHDLRTPLTSALGYLQMLETDDMDDETKAQYLEVVKGRLEALSTLMNSLFEFARVIEGNTEFDIKEVNICNVLRDTLSDSYAQLEANGFSVDVDIPDKPQMRMCDENALVRILQNLIKNVYVHGREYLRISVVDGVIEIANKAEGLEELDTERIFERFYTADASRTSKTTGLGLAISKELAHRMGGSIQARVENDLFIVSL